MPSTSLSDFFFRNGTWNSDSLQTKNRISHLYPDVFKTRRGLHCVTIQITCMLSVNNFLLNIYVYRIKSSYNYSSLSKSSPQNLKDCVSKNSLNYQQGIKAGCWGQMNDTPLLTLFKPFQHLNNPSKVLQDLARGAFHIPSVLCMSRWETK